MIEIYRDSSEAIYITIEQNSERVEPDGDVVVSISDKEKKEVLATGVAQDDVYDPGRYFYTLDGPLTECDRKLAVVWTYALNGEPRTKKETVSVVTPYVSVEELQDELPELATKEPEEVRAMERRARLIINAYTGQNFGRWWGKVTTYGQGGNELYISSPVLHIESTYPTSGASRWDADGWPIMPNSPIVAPLNDTWAIKFDGHHGLRFRNNVKYTVEGVFGWEDVPEEISEATKMLISDMFCKDSIYRQKGIGAVTSADWRLDYNDRAFAGTGNLDVDRLLSPYVVVRMLIL